jgi:hypothetical protein
MTLIAMGVLKMGPLKKCLPIAGYCLAHGYGHYALEQGGLPEEVNTWGLLNIASLVAIGYC